MADVYAQTLEMRRAANDAFPAQFARMLKMWLRDRWPSDRGELDIDRADTFKAADGSIFRWEPYRSANGYFADFILRHADRNSPEVSWSTRITLFQSHTTTVHIRISNTGESQRDPRFHTTRPRLALLMAKVGGCFSDGQLLDLNPAPLNAQALQDLAAYVLLDPERLHPVIVLTPRQDGSFVEEPARLAEEFASLGVFVHAADPGATFALTEEVGRRELSCFYGALRVYLPGFARNSDPLRHPLLLPRVLSDKNARLALAKALARFTVKRYREAPIHNTIRDERAVAYQNQIGTQMEALRAAANTSTDPEVWHALAEEFEKENASLLNEVADLRDEAKQADAKIAALRFQLSNRAADTAIEEDDDPGMSAQSIEDAVELAAEYYVDELDVLASAHESARESDFMRPNDVLAALRAMAEVARKVRQDGRGAPLDVAFRELGMDYRGGIARSTSKKQRQQYQFLHEGQLVQCEEHLCFGVKQDPKKCLRIYFSSSKLSEGKFIVGHVGRHLDTKRTS